MKKLFSNKIFILGLILVVLFTLAPIGTWSYFRWQNKTCGFSQEMKAFSGGSKNVYYWGESKCRNLKEFNKITNDSFQNLPKTGKFQIMTEKDDADFEAKIKKFHPVFNRLTVGEGDLRFIVYDINCESCSTK